jgi:hypothetical protein
MQAKERMRRKRAFERTLHRRETAQLRELSKLSRYRKRVEGHIVSLMNKRDTPYLEGFDELGVKSFLALGLRRIYRESQRGGNPSDLVQEEYVSKELDQVNIYLIMSTMLLGDPWLVPRCWHVSGTYVEALVNALNSEPRGKELMTIIANEIVAQVRESVLEMAPIAAELLRGVLDGSIAAPLGLRTKLASDALARVGFSPITKSVTSTMHNYVTADELEVLKKRVIAAREEIEIAQQDIVVLP